MYLQTERSLVGNALLGYGAWRVGRSESLVGRTVGPVLSMERIPKKGNNLLKTGKTVTALFAGVKNSQRLISTWFYKDKKYFGIGIKVLTHYQKKFYRPQSVMVFETRRSVSQDTPILTKDFISETEIDPHAFTPHHPNPPPSLDPNM